MSPSADPVVRAAGVPPACFRGQRQGRRDACAAVLGQGRRDACGTVSGQVNGNGMTMHGARHSAGFTLVELLVALAIFIVIMGSMAALLSGAVNTVNTANALMNAMERARGSMSVLEADLKTAFASPDKRQNFQFYGEPNGFMYSGQLVNGGFGRVTYAVHTDNRVPPLQGTGGPEMASIVLSWGAVAEQFARVLCPINPETGTGTNIDKNGDGVPDITIAGVDASVLPAELAVWNAAKPNSGFDAYAARIFEQIYRQFLTATPPQDFDDPVPFTFRVQRGVLLRYEERGQGTLSEFSANKMKAMFADSTETSYVPAPFGQDAALFSGLVPEKTREQLDQLQQSHYWVNMLSGNLPLNNAVDPFSVSNTPMLFWMEDIQEYDRLNGTAEWATDQARLSAQRHYGQSWRDYLVTEGILVAAELVIPDTDQVVTGYDSARGTPVAISALDMASFFSYGIEDGSDRKWFNTLWNLSGVALPTDSTVTKPMFNYFLFGPAATPVPNYFTTDPAGAVVAFGEALGVEVYGYNPGDPLKPRLPAWVAPGFWVFGDPSRVGAAPFHQWFQQKVDIPSAYLRDNSGT